MLYICTKYCENTSKGLGVIERARFPFWNLQRGIIPKKKKLGGVMVLVLRALSDDSLYLYKIS